MMVGVLCNGMPTSEATAAILLGYTPHCRPTNRAIQCTKLSLNHETSENSDDVQGDPISKRLGVAIGHSESESRLTSRH